MIKISISDGFSKSVDINLNSTSVSMITRFLHYICYADNSRYNSSSIIKESVSEFYDSNYETSMIQDAKLLRSVLDYAVNNLV